MTRIYATREPAPRSRGTSSRPLAQRGGTSPYQGGGPAHDPRQLLARELARAIQQPLIAQDVEVTAQQGTGGRAYTAGGVMDPPADRRGRGSPLGAASPWPAWLQRCGIGSSCPCQPHDKITAVQRDLQRATVGGGSPLSGQTRTRMERAFTSDFSAVRLHSGPAAQAVASTLHAQAVTAGTDILFGSGADRPDSPGGERLLAHELAHVVQQAHGLPGAALDGGATDPLEQAADRAADRARWAAERQEPRAAGQPLLQRKCGYGGEGSSPTGECDECRKPTPFLQTKLTIGAPHDVYEQEADRVAERVTRAPEAGIALAPAPPQISRNVAACEPEAQEAQRKSTSGHDRSEEAPALVHEVLGSPGRALDAASRAYFEPWFVRDFGQVRIHDDARAAASARPVNALAYTLGQHIVFGAGAYEPRSDGGRRLLAHELMHVVQQGAAPAAATHSPAEAAGEGATEAGDFRISRVSEPGRLQRQPLGGKDSPRTEACPPMERGEREEAAKAQLRLVERIPQQEWLIYGFPIGGSEISGAEAGGFIADIERSLMQGHWFYMVGQDPLEVLGFSDCFAGPRVDNHVLRQLRAGKFCAAVKDYYAAAPRSYTRLIRSCGAAPADQYVGSNATREDRAHNRSILIRRLAAEIPEEYQGFPYNPKFGPSDANCAVYSTGLARDILGPVYPSNARCSCLVTPDEPHNNCVRDCLQGKMWALLAYGRRDRKPNDPPMDINIACLTIWKDHRDCYRDCGCASEFIDYLAFNAVCNIALPCAIDSAAINLFNRCMPATKNDKYLPEDQIRKALQ